MSKCKVLDSSDLYTVGWIAALPKELAAAMGMLDERHGKPKDFKKSSSDTNSYQWGRIGDHNVVLALLPTGLYGTTPAATTAIHMLSSFPRIKVGLMVGIGAAIARPHKDRDIRLGDIVISLPKGKSGGVIQYDLGKDRTNEHQGEVTRTCERTGFLNSPPEALLKALGTMIATVRMDGSRVSDFLGDMLERHPRMTKSKPGEPAYVYQGQENDRLFEASYIHVGGRGCDECDPAKMILREIREDPSEPEVHYGIIASGNRVIKDATARDEILEKSGEDCICLEMEAAGLMNSFPCLVIRGICDYADSHKNDDWQEYAAATAAACAKEFLGFVDNEDLAETPNASDILKQISSNVKISMDNVNNTALIVQGMQLDAHQSKIVHWLSASDPSINYLNALEKRHEGTGLWFIQSQAFRDWKNQSKSFLWLYGIPGCGKTVLSSTIIEHLKANIEPDHALLYFYFKFNDSSKQTFESLLRSLVNQLYRTQPDTRSFVDQLWKAHHENNQSLSKQSLSTVLLAMLSKVSNFSIVLDALDEATTRGDVLSWLKSLFESGCSVCQILLTARREQDIESALQLWTQPETWINIQGNDVDRDIRAPDVQNELESELTEKAGGMFRWVACQLDALKNCLDYPRLKRALQNLPRTLDDTYTQILENMPGEYVEQTTVILNLLVRSEKPIQIAPLVDAIAVNLDKDPGFDPKDRMPVPQEVLKLCSSLVEVVRVRNDDYDIVRLAHFSVKEYLMSKNISKAFESLINETAARTHLARLCLTYLIAMSPLLQAIDGGLTRAAEYLMDNGANIDGAFVDDEGHSRFPLQAASRDDHESIVQLLLDRGADVNIGDGAALYEAVSQGYHKIVQLLLDRGADVNIRDNAALREASRLGHETIIQLLLNAGADVNARNGDALAKASRYGRYTIVQLLLSRGANVNANDDVALDSASYYGHEKTVRLLLDSGANVDAREGAALRKATDQGRKTTVQLLLERNASLNVEHLKHAIVSSYARAENLVSIMWPYVTPEVAAQRDNRGMNALHYAAYIGSEDVVRNCLDLGVDIHARDRDGKTALHWAADRRHLIVIKMLVCAGSDVEDLMKFGQEVGKEVVNVNVTSAAEAVQQAVLKAA
ncbi:Pfs, NACHT and ankyrin domain protein, partial [Aureobasidium melanogenum]